MTTRLSACVGGQRGDVLDPADGVDDPLVEHDVGQERPPRRQHHDVAGEGVERAGHLGVRADRDRADAQRGRLGGQQVAAESVAVALDDRDDARGRPRARGVRAPALGVDVQLEGHPSPLHILGEAKVERAVEREVPLAEVLDRLAAGADLELDQADVRVVGVEVSVMPRMS